MFGSSKMIGCMSAPSCGSEFVMTLITGEPPSQISQGIPCEGRKKSKLQTEPCCQPLALQVGLCDVSRLLARKAGVALHKAQRRR